MKIAIPNDNGNVSGHFGHCEEFKIFDIQNGKIVSEDSIPTPPHSPCALPEYLAQLGINTVIAGGMGMKALQNCSTNGITAVMGIEGKIETVLQDFLDGKLVSNESACCSHGADHHCGSH